MENSVACGQTVAMAEVPRQEWRDETSRAATGLRLRNDTRAEECSRRTSTRAWPPDIDQTVLQVELRKAIWGYHQCAINWSRGRDQGQRDNSIDSFDAANPSGDIARGNGNSGIHHLRRSRSWHKLEAL